MGRLHKESLITHSVLGRIALVAGLHGDEITPLIALATRGYLPLAGNPQALRARRRFIERDLNAAFGTAGGSYEEARAREILSIIPPGCPVVDFHSFSAESDPFAIIVNLDMLPLAGALGLSKVVYMKHNVKGGHSLCDHRNCVSVEVGQHSSSSAFDTTLHCLDSLLSGKVITVPEVYEVYDVIAEPGDFTNFRLHPAGFYPVFAGETAWEYFGLKARLLAVNESAGRAGFEGKTSKDMSRRSPQACHPSALNRQY